MRNLLARHGNGEMDFGARDFDRIMRRFFDWNDDEFPLAMGSSKTQMKVLDDRVEVKLPAPGCKPGDFDIEIADDLLTVKVTHASHDGSGDDEKHYLVRERSFSEYEESIRIPVSVKGHLADAKYVDGVLEIAIPREEPKQNAGHTVKVQ